MSDCSDSLSLRKVGILYEGVVHLMLVDKTTSPCLHTDFDVIPLRTVTQVSQNEAVSGKIYRTLTLGLPPVNTFFCINEIFKKMNIFQKIDGIPPSISHADMPRKRKTQPQQGMQIISILIFVA